MRVVKYIVVALLLLMLGVGIGAASASPTEVEPEPTVEPTPTPEPTPEPTPVVITETVTETVEVEVEVVPDVCIEALLAADVVMGESADVMLDILGAYVDYPDEDIAQFGRRVEDIIASTENDLGTSGWEDYVSLADQCMAY